MKTRSLNPLRLLNSVPFGITLMALTALYIAVGSGRPWLREWGVDNIPFFRNWFDLTDLQFFDAWPLKVLMGLLIANLVTVTWIRIPLTPPRYGVWCIHTGIIVLILGTSFYYHDKLEGRIRLYTSPSTGSISTDHYYDKDQRSLYVKIDDTPWNFYPLPNLPRFKDYDATLGNAGELIARGLNHIIPTLQTSEDNGKSTTKSLSQWMGWNQPLSFDIVGYYPYAQINTTFVNDPASPNTGVRITLPDMKEADELEAWSVSSDPGFRDISAFGSEFEHRSADATLLPALSEAPDKIFRLDLKLQLPGVASYAQTLFVQPGQTYSLGQTGYSFKVLRFEPNWPMFGTHEIVQALTVRFTTPQQTFNRMVLDGKSVQTDFKLNVPGAPPFIGQRQKEPLDRNLNVEFHFSDPYQLLPQPGGGAKHTLVTPMNGTALLDIVGNLKSACEIHRYDSGAGDIKISPADPESQGPMSAEAATTDHPGVKIHLQRQDHLRREDSVRPVPPAQRDRNAEDQGAFQVVKVNVHFGDWSQTIVVPYKDEAGDMPWDGGQIELPGTKATLQLQLGNTKRPLPAKLTLDKFELVPYPGGDVDNPRTLMRDFRSTVTLTDLDTHEQFTDVAHLNSPIYFRNGDWLFFQAAYDGQNRSWTQLGVGNRPGVRVMILGCFMIFAGLAYAFYLKPVIIRRMKQKALSAARARTAVHEQDMVLK